MSTTPIPDLWPESVKVDVRPPYAVLSVQARNLTERTQGVVEARVRSSKTKTDPILVRHSFELTASFLNYRHRLFSAWHQESLVYPVIISTWLREQEPTQSELVQFFQKAVAIGGVAVANDETALMETLRNLFTSERVTTLLNSLLASSYGQRNRGMTPDVYEDADNGMDGVEKT